MGRFKTALLTFVPPIVGGLLWRERFSVRHWLCEFAAATIWAAIVPALLARKSRERFGGQFRVWGGTPMIYY